MVTDTLIEIEIDAHEALRAMERVIAAISVSSLGAFMENEADLVIKERIKSRFSDQGDDASGKWAELREATHTFRRDQGFPAERPINIRTGQLRAWLLENMQPSVTVMSYGGVMGIWPGSEASNPWTARKFETAQKGIDGHTVSRPVLRINEADHRLIQFELSLYLGQQTGLTWT